MSIRKIWIGVLLDKHMPEKVTPKEREWFGRIILELTEDEADTIVRHLERSLEDVPDAEEALVRAKVKLLDVVIGIRT